METATFHQVQEQTLLSSATRILANAYASGKRLGVLVDSCQMREALDNTLWTYNKGSFIPHATETDSEALSQHIYITTVLPFHNLPDTAVLIDVEPPNSIEQKHLLVIFTLLGSHVNSIRQLYKSLNKSNCKITFVKEG